MGDLTENIMELCREYATSYTKMCNDTGVSRSLLTEIRKGRKKGITAKTAQKIADYFGVPVDRVVYGKRQEAESIREGEDDLAEYLEDLRDRPETRTLLAATRGMTTEQIKIMADFAKTIRGEK